MGISTAGSETPGEMRATGSLRSEVSHEGVRGHVSVSEKYQTVKFRLWVGIPTSRCSLSKEQNYDGVTPAHVSLIPCARVGLLNVRK